MRRDPIFRLLLLLGPSAAACTDPGSDSPGDTAISEEDSGPLTEWTSDEIGDQEVSNDWIFDTSFVHQIELEFDDDTEDVLWETPPEYAPASVTIDGQRTELVGIRLRGKIGSFRYLSDKPKWKIDFNRYVEGQRFHGLEALSLNNSVVDCSMLKEVIAADVLGELGVPGSRATYARLTVNDKDYGLNIVMEVQDDRFLKRQYAEPDGNLYDAKYAYDYTTGNYQLLDFGWGVDSYYQLEEGTDVEHADVYAISEAFLASAGKGDFYETMGELVDWEKLHRGWAAEQWLGQNDGYALNRNNTRLYFNPETGLAEQVLWDFDYSFLNASDWSRSWSNPTGNLAYYCRHDATCAAAWKDVVIETLETMDNIDVQERFDYWEELIDNEIRSDYRKECSNDYVRWYENWVDDWIDNSSDTVRSNWGL